VEDVGNCVGLGVIRYEPVDKTQTYFTRSLQEFYNFVQVFTATVKTLKARDNEFLFAVNLLFSCLWVRCYCWRLLHRDSML